MRRYLELLLILGASSAFTAQDGGRADFEAPARRDEEAALQVGAPPPPPVHDPHPLDRVLERHRASLAALDGVAGAGHGVTTAGDDAVAIWVSRADVAEQLPSTLDGYPVVVHVVPGGFDAYTEA